MLFCKPVSKKGFVFEQSSCPGVTIRLRSLALRRDLHFIAPWLKIPEQSFALQSQDILKSLDSHSFICQAATKRICKIEIHGARSSELGKQIRLHPNHCIMDLTINPLFINSQDLMKNATRTFVQYYFSFPAAKYLFATPGIHDHTVCRVLEQTGFVFQENIILPARASSLYLVTRKQFFN
jgi:hypothetical protein